ncbi:MAG: Ig-like domain-containing domain, partial [Myxococcaceae bacterium]
MLRRKLTFLALFGLVGCTCGPEPEKDSTPPTAVLSPEDGAKAVAYDAKLTATFSEPVSAGSVKLSLTPTAGSALAGSTTMSDDRTVATFVPSARLPEGAALTFQLAGGFTDDAGNAGAATSSSFTVKSDLPAVVSVTPADQSTDVALNTTVAAVFSEAMTATTLTSATFTLKEGATSVAATVTYNAVTRTATLAPLGLLLEGRLYAATLSSAAKDAVGIALAAPKTWAFTTVSTPPAVISTTPADQAQSVAVSASVTATFSEAMDPATITSTSFTLSQGSTAVAGAVTYDASTRTATLVPAAALLKGRVYAATLSTAAKDSSGTALAAAKTWSFTTASPAPAVTSTSPVDQALNVPVGTSISAVFSEPMDLATIDTTSFYLKDGATPIAAAVAYDPSSRTATLTPAASLSEGRVLSATVTPAVKDLSGIALASAKAWSFTTLATIPSVTGVTPAAGATGVAGNAGVNVVFSEAMDSATLDANSFKVLNGATAIAGTRTWDAPSRTATFTPAGLYPGGATLSVQVTTGAKDTSGIAMTSAFNSSFTVAAAPAVTSSDPAAGATGVPLATTVTLSFSVPMATATLAPANVWIENPAGAKVAASHAPASTSLVIAPSAPLVDSTVYTVVVSTNVRSAASVAMASEVRIGFTSVRVPPLVLAVTPANLSLDVPISAKVRVTFSKDMNTTTFTAANFRLSNGAADVAGSIAVIDARTLELTPAAPLLERSSYGVIAGTGLMDTVGNGLASEFRSSFTTEPLPRLVSVTPGPGALNVPLTSAIIIAANKALDPATVTITPQSGTPANTFTLWEGTTRIEGTIAYDASSRTIRITRLIGGAPAQWTAGKRYLLELTGTSLKDLNGNAVGGHQITSFVAGTASDGVGPSFVTSSP